MVDPVSLAALSAVVLSQGIGFVYGQLGELLRRRRERHDQAAPGPVEMPPAGPEAQALDGVLAPGHIDTESLDRHADQLAGLRGLLHPYVEGDRPVEPTNQQLLEQVDAARMLLEEIYGQRITFQGERRPATGTAFTARADEVGWYATRVMAAGERSVAVGGDLHGSVVITGDRTNPPGTTG